LRSAFLCALRVISAISAVKVSRSRNNHERQSFLNMNKEAEA
jgi:hypothetical protein